MSSIRQGLIGALRSGTCDWSTEGERTHVHIPIEYKELIINALDFGPAVHGGGVEKEYRYREGAHGEHCIDYGSYQWTRIDCIGRAARREDAIAIVAELNTVMDGTSAKLRKR